VNPKAIREVTRDDYRKRTEVPGHCEKISRIADADRRLSYACCIVIVLPRIYGLCCDQGYSSSRFKFVDLLIDRFRAMAATASSCDRVPYWVGSDALLGYFLAGSFRNEESLRGFPRESHIASLSSNAGSVKLFRRCAKFLPAVTGSHARSKEVKCPTCNDRAPMRVHRDGFLQRNVLGLFGIYPWKCCACGSCSCIAAAATAPGGSSRYPAPAPQSKTAIPFYKEASGRLQPDKFQPACPRAARLPAPSTAACLQAACAGCVPTAVADGAATYAECQARRRCCVRPVHQGMCAVPRLFTVCVSISVKSAVTSILCVECHNLESLVILVV